MARIRTIKPEFFRSYKLYKAEIEDKLPLRVAFAGIWTACDREGRFKWIPETLKLDCLPYDNCDFSRVLDALMTRGYIVKYEHENEFFGYVPTWKEHQYINNREVPSILPDPANCNELTREARVNDASETLPSGKEYIKGKEGKGKGKGRVTFTPPTTEEIIKYFIDNGYSEEAALKAHKYYETANWHDSKGNPVKSWKQKCLSVWFKPENQIKKSRMEEVSSW